MILVIRLKKLYINGSFEDVIKVLVTPMPDKKEEEKPALKKKKD